MKKQFIFLFLTLCITFIAHAQRPKKYYKDQIQAGEHLLKAEYHRIYIRTADGQFVQKVYYPEKKILTHQITYADQKFQIKEGPYKEWYDNGKVWRVGQYVKNKKEGEWAFYDFGKGKAKQYGLYQGGEKQGVWIELDEEGRILIEQRFEAGELHGEYKIFDVEGKIVVLRTYEHGEKKTEERFETTAEIDTMKVAMAKMQPYLKGCENEDKEKQKMCSDLKLLESIYQIIQYPKIAREHEIEGTAVFSFIIEKDGSMSNITPLRGLCAAIEQECLRVIDQLPAWSPGVLEGKPIKINFRLPVRFKLE